MLTFFIVLSIVSAIAIISLSARLAFYKAYFRQMQRSLGKNPDDVLKEHFGRAWRLIR